MAQRKSTSKKSKSTKRKSNIKKGKVYIPTYKLLGLCLGVIAVCVLLLLTTTLVKPSSPSAKKTETQSVTKRYENTDSKKTSEVAKVSPTPQKKTTENKPTEKKETPKQPAKNNQPQNQTTKPAEAQKPVEIKTTQKPKQEEPAKSTPKEDKKTSQPAATSTITTTKTDYNLPVAKNGAQLIFVFDDGGQNNAQIDKFISNLKFPYTVAVLPRLPYSVETARKVRNSGNEVILHQPMQSVNPNVNPGKGAITPDMNEDQIISTLFQNVNEISPISGMNNHEGSLITADAERMAVVMRFASEEGLYFLDSRTNVETKVPYVAQQMGYSYYERNIFLDNEKTRENVMKELKKGLDIANKNGFVIMIGHVWSADFLPQILAELYPELKAKGYTFSTVSMSKARK